jgi:fructokinase
VADVITLGVDLGGTKTEAAVLRRVVGSEKFEILARQRVATPQSEGYLAVLGNTAALVRTLLAEVGLSTAQVLVGVGMPGAVTRRGGLVKNSNTVCLNGRPFREDLSRAIGCPIAFDNDANCFALAETLLGAGRPYAKGVVFGVILGTGVGGGLILQGRPWPGPQNLGGEWGHHAVGPWYRWDRAGRAQAGRHLGLGLTERGPCYCGKTGCVELYLSGPAIEQDYQRRSGRSLDLRRIAEARSHDAFAVAALAEMLEAFGRALGNLISILDPSAIILGGGLSHLEHLYTEGVASVARYVFNDELLTPILKNELGDSAGVLGAALLQAPG